MATVDKNFRIKNGLAVEGSVATVNGNQILTENASDQYIINLIGGTATSSNTANTVVKRDANGDFAAGIITANLVGNVTGTVSSLSNHDTDDLAEGSNLYFTNQRALDATSAAYDPAGSAATAQANAISTASADATTKANAAQAAAEATASADATTKANAAQAAAEATASADATTKANAAQAAAEATASADATTKANAAQAAAELTASNALSSAVSTLEGQIADAETDANTYTDNAISALNLSTTYDAYGAAAQALSDAEDYTDAAVANLVDGAPALLDTLNELAAAIADNPNYATDVANLVAGKQDTLTAGSNIDITNDVISVTGLNSADISDFNTAALSATAAAYDAAGDAAAAQSAAETFATNAINALDTDDIEEGSNLYFTNQRALDATAAAYDAAGDAAAAQSAAEATAQAALDDVLDSTTPFESMNINDVAKQVAARVTSLGSVVVTAYEFNKTNFKSGKFLVKIDNGTHNEISEILVTLDSSDNVAITEYAIVGTNGSRGTITADVSGTHCRIRVNPTNDSTITVAGTIFNA